MGFLANHRRKLTIGTIIGAPLGIAGVAVAAFILTNFVDGQTGFIDSTAATSLTNYSGTTDSGVDCSNVRSSDGRNLYIMPKARRLVAQNNQTEVTPGACTITADVKNTGDVPVKIIGFTFPSPPPLGWSIAPSYSTEPFGPGDSVRLTLSITASSAAQAGGFQGQLESSTDTSGGTAE